MLDAKRVYIFVLLAAFFASQGLALAGPSSVLDPYGHIQAPRRNAQSPRGRFDRSSRSRVSRKKSTGGAKKVFGSSGKTRSEDVEPAVAGKESAGSKVAGGTKAIGAGMTEGSMKVGSSIAAGAKKSGAFVTAGAKSAGSGILAAGSKMKEGTGTLGSKLVEVSKAGLVGVGSKVADGGKAAGGSLAKVPQAMGKGFGKLKDGSGSVGQAIVSAPASMGKRMGRLFGRGDDSQPDEKPTQVVEKTGPRIH